MEAVAARRPLGGKSYGSIPHLHGSRRGPADHGVNDGVHRIATERVRDKFDRVIVQEKLDGSNVSVAKVNGVIHALGRAGYTASSSPHEMHRRFADWVAKNDWRFFELLNEGERLCGEWLIQAHGTRYELPHEPFVAFDLMTGSARVPFARFMDRVAGLFVVPKVLHFGDTACSIETAMSHLGERGFHGATELPEGAVWRVERNGAVDFLCKYVRPEKKDGCYLPEMSGKEPVWNTWKA